MRVGEVSVPHLLAFRGVWDIGLSLFLCPTLLIRLILTHYKRSNKMGLDMYLSAREYVSRNDYKNGEAIENQKFSNVLNVLDLNHKVEPNGWSGLTIELPVGYWRKANHIHNWFVTNLADGVDECQPINVSLSKIRELRDICKDVIANPEKADELLPTQSGFFFGGTDYDEYYYGSLVETIEILDRAINGGSDYFLYQASW